MTPRLRIVLRAVAITLAATLPLRAEDAAAAKKEHDTAVQAALDAFRKAYKGPDADRAAAVRGLATAKDRRIIEVLAKTLEDPAPAVRDETLDALAAYEKSREAAQAVLRALAAARKRPDDQAACLDALGRIRDWGSVPAVVDCFNDPSIPVAQAAIKASAAIRSPAAVPELITVLKAPSAAGAGATSWGDLAARQVQLVIPAQIALQQVTAEAPPARSQRRDPETRRPLTRRAETEPRPPAEARREAAGTRGAAPRGAEAWEAWWKEHGPEVTARLQKEEREELERLAKQQP
jgi:HEAT repeat protein